MIQRSSIKFLYLFLPIILLGCNVEKVEFSENDTRVWLNYKPGDILIFENQFGEKDTIAIVENEKRHMGWSPAGMDTPGTGKYNPINVTIWACMKGRINPMTGECKSVFVDLNKKKTNDSAKVHIGLYSFSETYIVDTLKPINLLIDSLSAKTYNNIYLLYNQHTHLNLSEPNDIYLIFWSLENGLIRYDKFNGEIWERINI